MGGAQEVPDSHAAGGTKHIRCCSAPNPEHTAGLGDPNGIPLAPFAGVHSNSGANDQKKSVEEVP